MQFANARSILLSIGLAMFAVAATAQTNLGGISGTVLDQSGAVIPGARITITNLGTGSSTVVQSSGSGAYSVTTLDPVSYSVRAELKGFSVATVERVKVDTANVTTVNITLTPGSTQTTVTVSADAPSLSTESGSVGRTVTQDQLVDLPLDGRSILTLAMTVPNVSGDPGSEDPGSALITVSPGANINVNGGRPGSTAILADGVNNTGVGLNRAVVTFSPDVVQEFTVQTSAFSAEYGQTGGGVINATTRSGTNEIHGSLNWYNRNPMFGAGPFSNSSVNRPKPTRKQNSGGATVGGPINIPHVYSGKNRTFFFAAFEPRRYTDGSQTNSLIPDAGMRQGDFSDVVAVSGGFVRRSVAQQLGVPITSTVSIYQQFDVSGNQFKRISPVPSGGFQLFPNNVIPATFLDPTSQKILKYLPTAGPYFLDGNGGLRNYFERSYVLNDEKRISVKVDHQITNANRVNFRISTVPLEGVRGRGNIVENASVSEKSASSQMLLGDTHVISPTAVNDLRLNVTLGDYSRQNPPEFRGETGRNLSTELGLPSLTTAGLPAFSVTSAYTIGQNSVSSLYSNVETGYGISDTLALTRGNMTIKIGADLRLQRLKTMTIAQAAGGSYSFNGAQTASNTSGGSGGMDFASFLLGVPSGVTLRTATVPYYYQHQSEAFFVQNDWKVRPNLTLNLGLRYSIQHPRTEKYDRQGIFLPDQAVPVTLTPDQIQAVATATGVAAGSVPTTTLIPAFGFSGRGGRPRGLSATNFNGFEPRFGFAWSPHVFGWNRPGSHTVAIRGGYGLSHLPLTGLSRLPRPDFGVPSQSYNPDAGQVDPNYVMRLSSNPPKLQPYIGDSVFNNLPANGLFTRDSINYLSSAFAISPSGAMPYVQNWNLTISQEIKSVGVVELAYVGSKGTHLFSPPVNMNPRSYPIVDSMLAAGIDPESTVNDPLGRVTSSGSIYKVARGAILTPYMGLGNMMLLFDPSSNSIRHAGYVSLDRRFRHGIGFTANYTYAKSIDDTSDQGESSASGMPVVATRTQVSYGGSRANERSVSSYDVRHAFASTASVELPFGRNKRWLNSAPRVLDVVVGGWQLNGVGRIVSGYPLQATMLDPNRLGTPNSSSGVRPDVVAGAPMLNPNWSPNCRAATCEPWFNPAAFVRPEKGTLGNAARTYDSARGPWRQFTDLSVKKTFRLGKDSRKRLEVHAQAINVFNHPTFSMNPSSGTGADNLFGGTSGTFPNEADISPQAYNSWATANNKPLQPLTSSGSVSGTVIPEYRQVLDITQNARGKGTGAPVLSGATLPADFFVVQLPNGFATMPSNSFNIMTPNGLKLFRVRETYNSYFGNLTPGSPRVIQFGIKVYF